MLTYENPGSKNLIAVTFDDGKTNPERIVEALKREGFPVQGKPVLIK